MVIEWAKASAEMGQMPVILPQDMEPVWLGRNVAWSEAHGCQVKRFQGFDVKVEGAAYGIKIAKGIGIFANRIEKPKAAIGEEVDRGWFFVK